MKRTFLATVLSIVFALVAVACHSSDEKEIGYTELPVQAQQFVKQYFPSATYSRVEKEKDNGKWEYEVMLSDGSKLDFDNKGEWKSVDCKFSALPSGIIPDVIAADIAKRYPSQQPYKIEKEIGGYEIDILGFDLYYSTAGKFIRAEIDR